MTIRHILFGVLAASVALTSAASARPAATGVPPPVGRIARELAGGGAKRVIVFASAGDKSYVATAGTQRPKANQRFRVGSVTKTFTATILLQLVDEGKLSLTSTLEDHLPGIVPRGAEITIGQLLQHRSGLANYTDYPSWYEAASRSPSTRPIDSLRFAASKPLLFDPGTRWSYSNTNYIALGLVVEQVTGRSYAQELEQRILQPLGLDHTELAETRRLPDLGDEGENPNLPWAAGSIVSNGRDIARFYSALLKARIVSATSLAVMKRAVEVGPDTRYGLGVFSIGARCGRAWGHYGGILDYATTAFASESGERVGVISIYGRPPFLQADLGTLVCPNYRLAESAATQHIAFLRGGSIYGVNADGSRQRRLAAGSDPAWSPNGRTIAFARGGAVFVMSADGGRQRRLVAGSDPSWSPNGRTIAFLRGGDVYVMHADGKRRRRRLAGGNALAWSPDGRSIAFVRGRGNRAEIFVANADGSAQRSFARGSDPAWSPDGRRIAFASWVPWKGVGGQFEIFVLDADGGEQRRLTRNAERDDAPAWSPDGRKIVFESGRGAGGGGHEAGWFVIAVVNADGSEQPKELSRGEPLVDQGAPRAARPLWSPDGRMIAYLGWRHGNYDVYVMNADGSGETNVTRSKADEGGFAWSPRRTR
jgi:D-alanyl-D-alanine carboxypeptidase